MKDYLRKRLVYRKFFLVILVAVGFFMCHANKINRSEIFQTDKKQILEVNIQDVKNSRVNVNSEFSVSWALNKFSNEAKELYEFVIFSMPNSVRLKGEGFLILTPGNKLPFDLEIDMDKLRVVFPLYLPDVKKRSGKVNIRPLLAGSFKLKGTYIGLDKDGKDVVVSSREDDYSGQFINLDIQDNEPEIVVQDLYTTEKPKEIRLSHSLEYELRIFENKFSVYNTKTGEKRFERGGTSPNFSPSSRFLSYCPRLVPFPSICIVDMLSSENIYELVKYEVAAWGMNDSILIISNLEWGMVSIVIPLLDTKRYFSIQGCHACSGWWDTQFAVDMENALVRICSTGHCIIKSLLIEKPEKKINEDRYTESLMNQGYPVSRTKPKVWEVEGGFKITNMSHVGRGMETFFLPLPYGDEKKTIKVVNINQNTTEVRGSPIYYHRRFEENEKIGSIVEKALIKRLEENSFFISDNITPVDREIPPDYYSYNADMLKKKLSRLARLFPDIQDDLLSPGACTSIFSSFNEPIARFHFWYWQIKENARLLLILPECDSKAASTASFGGDLITYYRSQVLNRKVSIIKTLANLFNEDVSMRVIRFGTDLSYYYEIRPYLSEKGKLIILSLETTSIIVFDPVKGEIAAVFKDVIEASDLKSLYMSNDGASVIQINNNGRFFIYNIKSQQRILDGMYVDDEFVIYTQDGFYDATTEGTRYVSWYYPGLKQHYDFSQFESHYRRPDIIQAALQGKRNTTAPKTGITPPPEVELRFKHEGNNSEKVTVELSAVSMLPLSSLRLFLDGVPTAEIPVSGNKTKKTFNLIMKRGKHWITGAAYDKRGFSSKAKTVMVDASKITNSAGNLLLLGVGIDHYTYMDKTKHLSYAKNDIQVFTDVIRSYANHQYEKVEVKQLLDTEAKPKNIISALNTIIQKSNSDDIILLYFAGHGAKNQKGNFYFLTPEASFKDFETKALEWDKVSNLLSESKARVLVFLDACHSGAASQETVVLNEDYAARLMKSGKAGMAVIAASKGRQYSRESKNYGGGHGAFNYAVSLVLGVERQTYDLNENSVIELSELYRGVKSIVYSLTKGEQTPWMARNDIVGELPIF